MNDNYFLLDSDINGFIDNTLTVGGIIENHKISKYVLDYLRGVLFVILNEPNISQEISEVLENSKWSKKISRPRGQEVFYGLTMLGEKSRERLLSKLDVPDSVFDKILVALEDKDEVAYLTIVEKYDISTRPISAICTVLSIVFNICDCFRKYQAIENDEKLNELQKEEEIYRLNNNLADLLTCSGLDYLVDAMDRVVGFRDGFVYGIKYKDKQLGANFSDFLLDYIEAIKPDLYKHIVEILMLVYFGYLKPRITSVSQDGFMKFLRLEGYEQMYDDIYQHYLAGGEDWTVDYYYDENEDLIDKLIDKHPEMDFPSPTESNDIEMGHIESVKTLPMPKQTKPNLIFSFEEVKVDPTHTAEGSNTKLAQWSYDHREDVENFANVFATKFHYIEEGKVQVKAFARFITGLKFDAGNVKVRLLNDKAVAAILYLSQRKIIDRPMSKVLNYFELPASVRKNKSDNWHSKFIADHIDNEYIMLVKSTFSSCPDYKKPKEQSNNGRHSLMQP